MAGHRNSNGMVEKNIRFPQPPSFSTKNAACQKIVAQGKFIDKRILRPVRFESPSEWMQTPHLLSAVTLLVGLTGSRQGRVPPVADVILEDSLLPCKTRR